MKLTQSGYSFLRLSYPSPATTDCGHCPEFAQTMFLWLSYGLDKVNWWDQPPYLGHYQEFEIDIDMEDSKKSHTIEEDDGEDFCHHYTVSITIPTGHLRIASAPAAGHQASVGQLTGHSLMDTRTEWRATRKEVQLLEFGQKVKTEWLIIIYAV